MKSEIPNYGAPEPPCVNSDLDAMFDALENARAAQKRLEKIGVRTVLQPHNRLSRSTGGSVFLKREDLQEIRSYKIRGAYNKIVQLSAEARARGIVCASAGNHAQGVAWSCAKLKIRGIIFMPQTTPNQKVTQVRLFGQEWIDIRLTGDTFDDAHVAATAWCNAQGATFVHPFDDEDVISGQATIALEILEDQREPIDILIFPVGGGGLAAGLCQVFSRLSPQTQLIAVEPEGAPSLHAALEAGKPVLLPEIDKFVDGAAVRKVGERNFLWCKEHLSQVIQIPEGKVCSTVMQMYNEDGMVVELAGALAVSALNLLDPAILEGKKVVCIVSGSNNDISRAEEIRQRALRYEGLKHYFMIDFPQRPGALKAFVTRILGESDDITYFQFSQKNHRESGPAVVGIQLKDAEDFEALNRRMEAEGYQFTHLNSHKLLFDQFIG